MSGFPGADPAAGNEWRVSRTGTVSSEEAEWLLRALPVLEADSRLKDMLSSSLVDWGSRTTWKTHATAEEHDLDLWIFVSLST